MIQKVTEKLVTFCDQVLLFERRRVFATVLQTNNADKMHFKFRLVTVFRDKVVVNFTVDENLIRVVCVLIIRFCNLSNN